MYIEIDNHSGFCYGVQNTINLAEKILKDGAPVYCLGEIVHNIAEVNRLTALGVNFITPNELNDIHDSCILIRTHGEPASTFELIKQNNNIYIDGTCPIVSNLQKRTRKASEEMNKVNGQVVLFGKKDHPEVLGISGQPEVNLIVVSEITDLEQIDFSKPVWLFSQTTQSVNDFNNIGETIKKRMAEWFDKDKIPLKITNSVCNHVSKRTVTIAEFVKKFDAIVFISGKNSSNGTVLFEICKKNNSNSYWISKTEEILIDWFINSSSVGICGATSTPGWQLEEASVKIMQMLI